MKVRLIAKTVICNEDLLKELDGDNSPEALIQYTARVSNPNNQTSNNPGLLRYCMKHKHWSIYQQADFTFEITTSRAIAAQILRHRADFQEFSQRYSSVQTYESYSARRQDLKNKQNSIDDLPTETKEWFTEAQKQINELSFKLYQEALAKDIAKEQARFLLTQATTTKMYMKRNVRDWLHYIDTRTHQSTQLEHREIAEAIKEILIKEIPIIAEAAGWSNQTWQTKS